MEAETVSSDTGNETEIDDRLQALDNEDLYQFVEETIRSNKVLETETQMFEKFLHHVDPKERSGRFSSSSGVSGHFGRDDFPMGGQKRPKVHSLLSDRILRLTAEQKCDIAQREIEELRDDTEKLQEESEKVLDTYRAIMEEADMRLAETKKESYEFERDILKGSVNSRTSKVIAEKVLRYFDDRLKGRDSLIEKLRLKNATFKVQKKKLILQLKQKEEMGEVLHEVDFNQLKIENQQYLERIDERNQDLLRLKLMAGNTLQVLNSYKKKLNTATMESERLASEITARNDLLSKIDAETDFVEDERAKAEKINRSLRQQLNDYRVPSVMEYVQEKASLYELRKKVKSWERKVEIAEMALATYKKTWKIMLATESGIPPWLKLDLT
ncbi:hypothetical protein C0Q70_19604 [Pomacea canaliculata]|uniref:Cilia- and flagella-associated protein 263 n=1 Tax=Pomacea canaliculata TaxID=400727 RepID=A0A2T7NJU1_POMCA|nr:coiled-coil domain-containing protein 113-like [Pomacea canaliculata]PVD21431.1 hypothetical protein C0Q70_19604 [Pomacea canaliculata]